LPIVYSSSATSKVYPSFRFLDGTFVLHFSSIAAIIESQISGFGAGTIWQAEGVRYEEVPFSSAGQHLTTQGGVRLSLRRELDHVRPDMMGQNTIPGTTDMTDAVELAISIAAERGMPFRMQRNPHLVKRTIAMPAELSFEGSGGSNYANPSRLSGAKFFSSKSDAGAVLSVIGKKLQSLGGQTRGLWLTSASTSEGLADLGDTTLYGLKLLNLFKHIFENTSIEHFNGTWAIFAEGQCNKLTFVRPRILIVGDRVASNASKTYGGGLYLAVSGDSNVEDPYIESLSGTGIFLGGNSKVRGGFVDLCQRGFVVANGENSVIDGVSSKFHQKNCLQVFETRDFSLRNSTMKSGNTSGAAHTSNDAATIRVDSGVIRFEVCGCDFRHVQQWRGPNLPPVLFSGALGNTIGVKRNKLGDVAVGATHIVDPNGNWAAGNIEFIDNDLDLGSARTKLLDPVAFAPALTVTSDYFTVTYGGDTYVALGKGHSFPWTTSANFNAADWVLLQERDKRGLVIPNDVSCSLGQMNVRVYDGATDDWALTIGQRSDIDGIVRTNGIKRLVRSGGGSLAPSFQCDQRPEIIADVSSDSGTVKLRGLSWPVSITHSGSGLNETFALADMPSHFRGDVTVTGRTSSNIHIAISAYLEWDGTELTVSSRGLNMNSSVFSADIEETGLTATFVSEAGELKLLLSSATPVSMNCRFEFRNGYWTVN
jgi:hypothetical protein